MKPITSLKTALLALALTASTATTLFAADGINASNFVSKIDNPFFPLVPGTTYIYSGLRGTNSLLRNRVQVTSLTRVIAGVTCRQVRTLASVNGVLGQETTDSYAQDRFGNVWHFGADTRRLDTNGNVISLQGSWEAGVGGAQPGIVMLARPHIGDIYQEGFAPGVAENTATVASLTKTVTVPIGTFSNCLQIRETSPLEPGTIRQKSFARGIGLIQSVSLSGTFERLQLVNILRNK